MSHIRWDYDDDDDKFHFELDQHAYLDFNIDSSLKQQSAGRHVTSPGHTIPIPILAFGLTQPELESVIYH